MRIAFWTSKTKKTHSEYVIITAFQLQKLLKEHTSILRYTYIVCFVGHKTWYFEGIRTKIIATVGSICIEIVTVYVIKKKDSISYVYIS